MLRRCLVAVPVVLIALTIPAAGQDKALLKWDFGKNKVFYQTMTTKTEQTMKVMNNEVKQTQNQTFYFSWTVEKQEGDSVVLKQKIEGIKMEIDIGQQKISYDSVANKEGQAGNVLGEFFKALVGSEFKLTIDTKTNKVTKIEGRDDFLKKLVNANQQMRPLLEQILSEKALQDMAEPIFGAIPGKEVAKGESWTNKTTLEMGPIGKYENDYKYTLEKVENNKATIKAETTLKYSQPQEVAGGGTSGLPFKIKSADLKSSNATGQVIFDVTKGRIESSTMSLNLAGELNIEIGGQTTKVELTQTQTSNVSTSDENPTVKKP